MQRDRIHRMLYGNQHPAPSPFLRVRILGLAKFNNRGKRKSTGRKPVPLILGSGIFVVLIDR
jgi:hypothetical protein